MFRSGSGRAPAWSLRFVLVMLATLLSACGGGGGGGGTSAGADGGSTPVVAPGASIVAVVTSPALVGDPVKFTGVPTGSRAPLALDWDFGDGSAATAAAGVEHSYAAPGTYRVTFRVTDAAGVRATATSSVVIEPRSGLSIATDRSEYTVGQPVRLSASGDYRNAKTYEWDFGDGRRASGPETEVTYAALGQRTVTLVATYEQGYQRKAQATIGVSTSTPSFTLSAPAVIYSSRSVVLTATPGADGNERTDWNFGDGSSLSQGAADVPHAFPRSGTYQVTATRTNRTGYQYSATMSITVLPPPPPSGVTLESIQRQAQPGQGSAEVSFLGRVASDAGDLGTLYAWDFGDGTTSQQSPAPTASHSFARAGSYVVTLTATNAYGLSASGTATVSVGPRQMVKLLAGQGVTGTQVDGPALSAIFLRPQHIRFDTAGNLFVSDTGNMAVRKISVHGEVSTVAMPAGVLEGWSSLAPADFALAAFGRGETYAVLGNKVVRINPDGSSELDDRFSKLPYMSAIAQSPSGDIVVAAQGRLWRLAPGGEVVPMINSFGLQVAFENRGNLTMAFDAAGMLYVVESTRICKVAPDGTVSTLAGSLLYDWSVRDGTGTEARFGVIADIAVAPDGTVYTLEYYKGTIRRISPSGEVRTLPVSLNFPNGDAAQSWSLALSPEGVLFVSDGNKGVIRRINANGSLTVVAGREWVNGRVDGQGASAMFFSPQGIAQGPSGALYVADSGNRALRKVTLSGEVITLASFPGSDAVRYSEAVYGTRGGFSIPWLAGVAVDDQENVYVADTYQNVIRKVSPDGTSIVLAGRENMEGTADGTGSEARFYGPMGVAVDAARNVYVGDTLNHSIRKITPSGTVTTIAGSPGKQDYRDGIAGGAYFTYPTSLAAAPDGTLWVADYQNQLLRKITPGGEVTTVAGRRGTICDGAGPLGSACVPYPIALSYDASTGDVYVASSFHAGIQRLRANGWYETLLTSSTGPRLAQGPLPALIDELRGVAVLSNGQIAMTAGNAVLITSFGP